MNNYMDDHAKYCCLTLKYLVDDERTGYDDDGKLCLWTSRTAQGGDWEPELLELNYCPNCGAKL